MHQDAPAALMSVTAVVVNGDWKGAVLSPWGKPGASDVRNVKCVPLCGKKLWVHVKACLALILNLECINEERGRFFSLILLLSFHKSNSKGIATQ